MTARPFIRLVPDLLTADQRRDVLAEIDEHRNQERRIDGKAGFGPRYSVLGGDIIAASMPRVAEVGDRARELVEEYAATTAVPFADPVRRARVQTYENKNDGFRWHFDGHPFVALVTLENDSDGVTEFISPTITRIVKPLFYPAYPLPQIFSLLPRTTIVAQPGDALIFSGMRSLHRGRSRKAGRRTILVFAFDVAGAKPSRIRNWFARLVNY